MTIDIQTTKLLFALLASVLCGGSGTAAVAEDALIYRRFNVTDENGRIGTTTPIPEERTPLWAREVSQQQYGWEAHATGDEPYFKRPVPFVTPPVEGSDEPFYPHNHCPALTWCENGDLLVAWFSTVKETGLEMTILASRLRAGAEHWDTPSEFFKAPNRNMTGTALFHDGNGRFYHFNGMGRDGVVGWTQLALLLRTSTDNGVSWTPARPISTGRHYKERHQVIAGTILTRDGVLIQPCDATSGGQGPSAIHISRDSGETWSDPGGDIRGIHAGVVELKDGRLLAFGRGRAIDGQMPMSVSDDRGRTWQSSPSRFPPISSAQRLVLMRLREGPILLISFTGNRNGNRPMTLENTGGGTFKGKGIFAALSYDDGKTWPVRKLITPGDVEIETGPYFGANLRRPAVIRTTAMQGELEGYLAATQPPDGVIHLISSRLHYQFNLAWLKEPNTVR